MDNTTTHKEGQSWDIFKRFPTFKEADEIRKTLLDETEDMQVKVQWLRKSDSFAVKTRIDPVTEAAKLKKEEKAKRKKRLNKKRRKK